MRVLSGVVAALALSFAAPAQSAGDAGSSSLWPAAWRNATLLGAFSSDRTFGADDGTLDPDLDPIGELEGTGYWPFAERAAGIFNRRHLDAWKAQVGGELADRRVLEAGG